MERDAPGDAWRAGTLTDADVLCMPEIGIEIPVAEFYEDVEFPDAAETA